MDPEVPFGRYVLLKKIASGGMAEIFLAKQVGPGRFERRLVIKRILPHLAEDPKFVGMFLDEAALAAQLSHPHIAQLYDFGEEGGRYFLALELVRGPDLASIIEACRKLGRPPPIELSLRLVCEMLEALHYAHQAADEQGRPLRLVHRDVSPQNVLCSQSGVVKLIDFGIAKAASAVQRTDTGMVKGKFTYMAPEQLRGDPLDGRCDQYAAALVLYELLTLKTALQAEGAAAISNCLEARIVPVAELRPDLPPALVAAVGAALRKRREERFSDCAEFGAALEGVLAGQGKVVQAAQIEAYLKSLEAEVGAPLSPVALGSSSGEKAPSLPGSGPHDTAITGTPPARPQPAALDSTALSSKGVAALPPPSPPASAPLPAPAAARSFPWARWLAVAACLLSMVAGAAGWNWYSARARAKAVVPAVAELPAAVAPPPIPAPAAAPVPTPVAAAPKPPEPAVPAAPPVAVAKAEPPPHPSNRGGKHGAREHPHKAPRAEVPTASAPQPAPATAATPPRAATPNYRQVAPPAYPQQSPYYQNGYYQNGYQYQYQQPQQQYGQPQQAYPYGQQAQPYPYQQPQQQQGYRQ